MADPFDALRLPDTPVNPSAAYTARLRARIERALTLPQGVFVSTTLDEQSTSIAPALGAAIPYLAVGDAARAIDWYVDVFGARVVGEPIVMPDGRIGHCELTLAGGTLYLADEFPEIGVVAPDPATSTVSLMLAVADADVTLATAVAAGGRSHRDPYDGYGQRNSYVVDPFGHRWGLHSPLPATPIARQGDLVYASLWVPDAGRAADFYAAVLGWTYHPAPGPHRRVANTELPLGIVGGHPEPTLFCCYAVDDVDAAVERVRAAGGSAEGPREEPYGRTVDCMDDQGTPFALNQATGTSRPAAHGAGHGDLGYLTLFVADSAQAREFCGAVLGWRFGPGGEQNGWEVRDVAPMTGLSGGHPRGTGLPMWRVDDMDAAVQRVRAAGGVSTEPDRRPYGLLAECTDDQGSRFFLGQL